MKIRRKSRWKRRKESRRGVALFMVPVSYTHLDVYKRQPVITSNVTSLPEIAGDAAMLVDPYSIDAIADAMGTLEKDSHFRQTLIDKGRIQRSKYTWDKAATAIWQSIELTLSDNNRFNKK